MNQHQDQEINNWAKQNLQNGFDANRFDAFRLAGILLALLTGLITAFKILDFFTTKNPDIANLLGFSAIATLVLPLAGIIYLNYERKRAVIYLDSGGVQTRGGKKYQWSELLYANYETASLQRRQQLNRIELRFENGKAVVPAFYFPGLVDVLKTLPVPKRFNGSDSARAIERLYLEHGIE